MNKSCEIVELTRWMHRSRKIVKIALPFIKEPFKQTFFTALSESSRKIMKNRRLLSLDTLRSFTRN